MDAAAAQPIRRPRFRRAGEPPAFRVTDGDVEIVRHVGRHRFARSTDIAALVGRSLDRTNDRLMRLFQAGYLDRPRAQLDRFPTDGSGPMVYALANRGARLLCELDGVGCGEGELSRRNRRAGRPFIEHQIEIVNFEIAVERAVAASADLRLIRAADMRATERRPIRLSGASFALRAKLWHNGMTRERSVIPDLVFGVQRGSGDRRNFMVEIDRGMMPVRRADADQTSFEGKMRVYLSAHAGKQHHRQFGWKNFRVLTITTDAQRLRTMQEAARDLRVPRSIGSSLFLFATFSELRASDPLTHKWLGEQSRVELV